MARKFEETSDVPKTNTPCYTGKNVTRYGLEWSGLACLLDRKAKRGGCWDDAIHDVRPKIITRQIGITPVFGLDERGFHCLNTVFMLTPKATTLSTYFLLGLLNSRLMTEYWRDRFYDQRDRFPKIKGGYLKQLPIRPVDLADARDRTRHNRVVELVEQILAAKRAPAGSEQSRQVAARKIAAIERQIDSLVYELYGLGESEIALLEAAGQPGAAASSGAVAVEDV
jgi:hypothetical protein